MHKVFLFISTQFSFKSLSMIIWFVLFNMVTEILPFPQLALTCTTASFWCLYFWLWTYFTPCFNIFIVNFEHVIANWVPTYFRKCKCHSLETRWEGYSTLLSLKIAIVCVKGHAIFLRMPANIFMFSGIS